MIFISIYLIASLITLMICSRKYVLNALNNSEAYNALQGWRKILTFLVAIILLTICEIPFEIYLLLKRKNIIK